MKLLNHVIVFLISGLSTIASARAEPPVSGDPAVIETARNYLAAYMTLDIDALTELYAPDVVFTDPTSFATPNIAAPVHYEGRAAVIAFIASLQGVMLDARYDLDRVYEASGAVVFTGDAVFTFSAPPGPATFRSAIVTVVTIKDGLVSEHRDYADYNGIEQCADACGGDKSADQ